MTITSATFLTTARRGFIGICVSALGVLAVSAGVAAAASSDAAQKIADHFSGIQSMSGDFIQFGPRGEQTGGKFFLQRPGKIRFNYDAPSAYRVISDGKSVVIDNKKLNTIDLYPLSKTPLKMLLDDRIDLSGNQVKSVKVEEDVTTIQIANQQVFGKATISMMFDSKSYELRQWTITDAQGKDTTVLIDNVKQGVKIDPALFKVDYQRNLDVNKKKRIN